MNNRTQKQFYPRNKFHNKPVYVNGKKVADSVAEYERYWELKLLERAGKISDLRKQVRYELIPAQFVEETGEKLNAVYYVADFVYVDNTLRRTIVEDVKGFQTDVYKIKKKLMFQRYGILILETGERNGRYK